MRRGIVVLVIVLAASGLAPAPLGASCQSEYCYRQYRQQDRQREAKLKRQALAGSMDRWDWSSLLDLLQRKFARERFIAVFDARLHWESQPILEEPDLFRTRYEAEYAQWLALAREARAEEGDSPCRQAQRLEDPLGKVEMLRAASEELPDNPAVFRCLAHALVEVDRADEAVTLLEAFREEHPDLPEAHTQLTGLLGTLEASEERMRALEIQARQFLEDLESQKRLLSAYHDEALDDRRDGLFEKLWQQFSSPEDHRSLCWAFSSVSGVRRKGRDREAACLARVLREHEESAETGDVLYGVRDSLLSHYMHQRDWPAIRALAAGAATAQELLSLWSTLVNWIGDDGGCTELGQYYDTGGFDRVLAEAFDDPSHVLRLAGMLRKCDRQEDGATLLRAWLPRQAARDLRWDWGYPDLCREELRRRLALNPEDPGALRAYLEQTDRGSEERLDVLRRLADLEPERPEDVRPLLELAQALEQREHWNEAVRVLHRAVERKPEDGDLILRAGMAALHAHDLAEVKAAAGRLLRMKATSVRQRAEAGYLLGRVALREGRVDEAIRRFDHYYSLRFRYEACQGWASCDLPFQLLLLSLGKMEDLEDYLDRRDRAVAVFRNQLAPHIHLKGPPGDLVVCSEPPCRRPTAAEVEDAFRGKDQALFQLARILQQVR